MCRLLSMLYGTSSFQAVMSVNRSEGVGCSFHVGRDQTLAQRRFPDLATLMHLLSFRFSMFIIRFILLILRNYERCGGRG